MEERESGFPRNPKAYLKIKINPKETKIMTANTIAARLTSKSFYFDSETAGKRFGIACLVADTLSAIKSNKTSSMLLSEIQSQIAKNHELDGEESSRYFGACNAIGLK
jgi:hypothetical protein